jgi:hypothetical protein
MLGPRSKPMRPAKPRAAGQPFPLSALLALNCDEQPGNDAIEQGPPLTQMPPEAVFPPEENHPVPAFFAADTPFDCEDGEGAADWTPCAD